MATKMEAVRSYHSKRWYVSVWGRQEDLKNFVYSIEDQVYYAEAILTYNGKHNNYQMSLFLNTMEQHNLKRITRLVPFVITEHTMYKFEKDFIMDFFRKVADAPTDAERVKIKSYVNQKDRQIASLKRTLEAKRQKAANETPSMRVWVSNVVAKTTDVESENVDVWVSNVVAKTSDVDSENVEIDPLLLRPGTSGTQIVASEQRLAEYVDWLPEESKRPVLMLLNETTTEIPTLTEENLFGDFPEVPAASESADAFESDNDDDEIFKEDFKNYAKTLGNLKSIHDKYSAKERRNKLLIQLLQTFTSEVSNF